MRKAKYRISKETPNLPSVEFKASLQQVSEFVLGIKGVYLDIAVGESVFLGSGAKLIRVDEGTYHILGFEDKHVASIDGVHIFADLDESLQLLLKGDFCEEWDYIDA